MFPSDRQLTYKHFFCFSVFLFFFSRSFFLFPFSFSFSFSFFRFACCSSPASLAMSRHHLARLTSTARIDTCAYEQHRLLPVPLTCQLCLNFGFLAPAQASSGPPLPPLPALAYRGGLQMASAAAAAAAAQLLRHNKSRLAPDRGCCAPLPPLPPPVLAANFIIFRPVSTRISRSSRRPLSYITK